MILTPSEKAALAAAAAKAETPFCTVEEFIDEHWSGDSPNKDFAKSQGVSRGTPCHWKNAGGVVINGMLYKPHRRLKVPAK